MTNWKCCWSCSIILFVAGVTFGEKQRRGPCNLKQYIELGKTGIIQCSFEPGMYGIYWYGSDDVEKSPFFYYENSKKSGHGYTSGEFDVEPNGSLVIKNVTFEHDHVFTVACLVDEDQPAVSASITVVVVVKPSQPYPLIRQCYGENTCYTSRSDAPKLNCFVADSKPAVRLQWFRRTMHSDQTLSSEKSISNLTNFVFSSYANLTTAQLSDNHFIVAVCKAQSVPPMFAISESVVLLEGKLEYSSLKKEEIYTEKSKEMKLDCLTELEIDSTSFTDENFSKLRNHVFGRNDLSEIDATALLHISKTSDHSARASLRFLYSLVTGDTSTSRVFRGTDLATTAINLKKDDEVLSYVKGATDSTMISQQSNCNISWPDVLFTIYHSCKPTFREEVVSKMSSYNMAVPFLLPSPLSPIKVSLLFTDLQNVKKELVEKQSFTNVTVTEHPFPTVAAVRIGEIGFSKSNILNLIIGSLQNKEDAPMFPASNEDDVSSSWSRGTVEAGWFLPTEPTETHNYSLPMATCFLNLRGRMGTERTKLQEKFLFLFSSCILIFVQKSSYEQQHESLINEVSGKTHVILVVFPDDFNKGQPLPTILRKGECLTVIIFQRCSELKIAREISKQIVFALKENETIKTLEKEGRQICKDLDIKVQ